MGFATLQFFSLIYLQKIALFAPSFALDVSMLILFASVGWMLVYRRLSFSASRLAMFLIFACFCLFSESLARGSLPSLLQLLLLYICMTVSADVSAALYKRIANRFVQLMIVPACIMIVQYAYQKLTGLADPFNLERFVPRSLLMPGFFYNAHYPWYSTFSRPNGFFFLEPSFASAYTAAAAILEISYFRRPWRLVLMLAATILSMGATGILMLVIAAPFLLSQEPPRFIAPVAIAAVAGLMIAYWLGVSLPMTSRVDEIDNARSSGGERLLLPALEFQSALMDPSYYLTGRGAGSTSAFPGSMWPFVKLLHEYGLPAMVSFLLLFALGFVRRSNLALKVALSIIYLFTGGYLLSPAMAQFVILFLFILPPREYLVPLSRDLSGSRSGSHQRPMALHWMQRG
jgi:hypothetical protein